MVRHGLRALTTAYATVRPRTLSHLIQRPVTSSRGTAVIEHTELEMWANAMAALPNIGGALCSTPQSLADAHY